MSAKELRPHQAALLDDIRDSLRRGNKRIIAQAVTGFGKCLGLGTPVLMYDGRVLPIEDIRENDLVMGPDSRPRIVLSTCRGTGPLYRIVPVKGEPWVCNDVHVLTIVDSPSGRVEDVPLDQFLNWNKSRQCFAKLFSPRAGVSFLRTSPDPQIPAYFSGLWVGDGSKRLNTVAISKPDHEVFQACRDMADAYGYEIRTDGKTCPTYHVVAPRGQPNLLMRLMKAYFSDGIIPHQFLTASDAYRMEFLAGILDADGHLVKGTVFEITQKSTVYADSIAFLARSLGLKVTRTVKIVRDKSYHRLHIFGDTHRIPTRIPRKQATVRQQRKDPTRVGFRVEAIGEGEYAGFELDGDGRFLLGDFTVTHNTVLATAMIRNVYDRGRRALFVVPAVELVNQTVERFAEEGITDVGVIQANHEMTNHLAPIQVASIQTLLNRSLEETCEEVTRRRSVAMRDEFNQIIFEEYTDKDGSVQRRPKKVTVNKDVLLNPIPHADLVVIDEAHVLYDLHNRWMNHPRWKHVPFIGLSATPWTRGLGCVYQDLVCGMPMVELIENKFLSPFRVFAPSHPDLSNVRTMAGEYHEGDLEAVMNQGGLIADIVENWLKHGEGRPTLCFCVNRAHAQMVQQTFQAVGVRCGYVDAFTSPEDRRQLQRDFASGEIEVVCNVGVLTTGVDWDVRCIILARPTRSEMLFVQIIGRGLRTADGKEDCIARGTMVLTDQGEVPIEDITLDHKVWDGVAFVRHAGAICKGRRPVITYDGLTATPDHEVMTDAGWVSFAYAASRLLRIARTGSGRNAIRLADDLLAQDGIERMESHGRGSMQRVRFLSHGTVSQYAPSPGAYHMLHVQAADAGHCTEMALQESAGAGQPLSQYVRQAVSGLRRAWDRVSISNRERCGSLDSREYRRAEGQVSTDRQGGELWPLRAGQSALGYSQGEHEQSTSEKAEVWDILNAGPNHRFTAGGKLVHNCVIFDHSDNHLRMGFVTDLHKDRLDTGEKAEKKERDLPPERLPKECPKCSFLKPPKMALCPNCGFEPVKISKIECQDGELVEITGKRKRQFSHETKQLWYSMFLWQKLQKGYKPGWEAYKFKEKFDEWPKGLDEVPTEPNEEFHKYIKHLNIKSSFKKKRFA